MANEGIIKAKAGTVQKSGGKTLRDLINSMQGEIAKALPSVITPERFTRIVLSAVSSNPQLAACTPKSFLAAMMQSAQLGLEVNSPLGQSYLIAYKNHGQDEVQFQLGYKGLIDLAYRSGEIASIQAQTVYENDEFHYAYGLEPKLEHIPSMGDRGEPIAYYAVFKTKDGGYGFEVMSKADIAAHAQRYSKAYSYSSSPWKTNFDEMAKKTVLKRVLKYAPLRTDFQRQLTADETIKTEINSDMLDVADDTDVPTVDIEVDNETGEVTVND